VLDNLALWTAIALVLVALAYGLPLGAIVADGGLFGPGISPSPAWLPEVLP
jgi:cytochrome c oxidase subunit 1